MNEWKDYELGNLADIKGGKRLPKGKMLVEYKTEHPYIRVTDITNYKIDVNTLLFATSEQTEQEKEKIKEIQIKR